MYRIMDRPKDGPSDGSISCQWYECEKLSHARMVQHELQDKYGADLHFDIVEVDHPVTHVAVD